MNQALISAMLGTGLARERQTVDARVITGILRGWVIAPGVRFMLAYAAAHIYRTI